MEERRGRPSEQPVIAKDKWELSYGDGITEEKITYYFDRSKTANGPYKTEIKHPRKHKSPDVKPIKNKAYNNMPVIIVFKTSERKNAKTKMKVFYNQNINYITEAEHLPGIPDNAIWLEIGVGESFIERYKLEYNL